MASVSAVLTLRLSAERRRRLAAVWGAVVSPSSPLCPTVTGPSGRTCAFYRRTVGLVSVSSVQMYASYPCAHTCFQSPSCRWVQHKHMLQSFGQTVLMMWLLQSECTTSDRSQPVQNAAEYADTVYISVIIKVMIQAGWWHTYTKIQCFLNAVQIQKCVSRKLVDKPSVPSPETVGLALLPAAVAVSHKACSSAKCHCLYFFSLLPPTCHSPRPPHSLLFYHPNNFGWRVWATKLLIMQFSPGFYYFLPLTPVLFNNTFSLLPRKLSIPCISS